MADYSENDADYARQIVGALLDNEREAIELEDSVVISDLEADTSEFVKDLELLEHLGVDVPAMRLEDEDLVPVALSLSLPVAFGARLEEAIDRFETISREQARSNFVRRATDFLATRISAVRKFEGRESRQWPGLSFLNVLQRKRGSRVLTPGCTFTVSANSNGLRVHWSGAYRISRNYFCHPTTPATSVLQAGTYVFGVDGGAYGNVIQWDTNAIISLPGIPHMHLQY